MPQGSQKLEARLIDAVLGHRRLVAAVVAVLSGSALLYTTNVGFDSPIETWFLEGDPRLATYERFLDRFEADEVTVVGVFTDGSAAADVFEPEILALVDRMTQVR